MSHRGKTSKHKVRRTSRTSYSIKQKENVVSYAKENGRNRAAAYFGLDKSMVGRWVKASKNWTEEVNRNSKKVGSGRKSLYPEAKKSSITG